ncbi:hypothetical protein [uncultured Phycicoccus sp.]|uniref:hypothetical protein n=1 Tax=uncultured Phycicoccus sp. TaxID=661422 RepID=UPI00261A4856|nr:hypothetical protein [uncultured Phycicoccus sp.]
MDLVTASPAPLHTRRERWRPAVRPTVRTVSTALVVLHVLAVGWLTIGGDLFIDDLRAQAYAAGRPLWPFVVESNATHLAPGARTVDWLMATRAPLEHWPAAVLTLAIAAFYGVAAAGLVRRVVAHPAARVAGLSWLLFAASVVPTFAWFRQALTTMLPLALVLLATSLAIDHARTRRWQPWALSVACHAVALTFSERALAVPVVVLAVLLTTAPRRPTTTVRRLARGAVVLLPHTLLNLAFLATYLSGDFDTAEGSRPSAPDAVVKVGRWVLVDLLPSFVGGPVLWRTGNGPYSFAATPTVLVVLAAALLGLGLLVAGRTAGSLRAAAPVLLGAAAYAVPVLAMVYVGRLAQVDDIAAADDLRLLPDVSAAVALGLAALLGAVLDRRGLPGRRFPRQLSAAGAAVVVALTAVTWVGFGVRWHDTPVTAYLSAVRSEVTSGTGQVLPTTVPAEIMPGWVDPGFTTGPLVRLLNPASLSGARDGPVEVIGPTGSLVPPTFGRVAAAPVPEGFCGFVVPVGQRSLTIPFDDAAPYYRGSMLELGVLVGDAERLNLRVTGRDGATSDLLVEDPPELLRGPHRIHALVPVDVAVSEVILEVETGNTAGVCVTSAQVLTVGPGS